MKAKDVALKTEDQLKADLVTLKKEAFNLRFQRASGQLEKGRDVRRLRARKVEQLFAQLRPTSAAAPDEDRIWPR